MNKVWKFATCARTLWPQALGVKGFSTNGVVSPPHSFASALSKTRLSASMTMVQHSSLTQRSFVTLSTSLCHFQPARAQLAAAAKTAPVALAAAANNCSAISRRLTPSLPSPTTAIFNRYMATLEQMHRSGPLRKKRKKRRPLDGKPMLKGVVLKTVIKKPRKPNSANRKCVIVRLSNGKEMTAYVPGEGHNLQEHNLVLVRCGRLQDVPGVKVKVIRGKYDCAHVVKKTVTA